MTVLPSIADLKTLLAEATPGPWELSTRFECDNTAYEIGPLCVETEFGEVIAPSSADLELAALAPVLLAEVIRLREELGVYVHEMEDEIRELYQNHQQSDKADALDAVADDLTRILGGEA